LPPTRPLQVLDLRDSPWFDGPGRTVLEVAEGLESSGIRVTVGSFGSGDAIDHAYLAEAAQRGLPVLPVRETSAFDLKVAWQIRDFCRRSGTHLIHCHELRSNIYGLWAGRRLGIPVVATVHGWIANDTRGKAYTLADKILLRFFDAVVTVSHMLSQQLRSAGISAKKLSVVPNALDTRRYVYDATDKAFRRELKIADNTVLLANIGRLSPEKGQEFLLPAFHALLKEGFRAHLVLVGIGPDEQPLKHMAATLGVTSAVSFVGFRTDMRRIYNSADIVVQSSTSEGMPNVILEAMAMERPVVATEVGGTPELIVHGKHGLLVPPGSVADLSKALCQVMSDRSAAAEMSTHAARRVRLHFDSSSRLDTMRALYRRVASS
jgi:glycosyltransferase involved in cell wall biosynthesis